MSTPIYYTIPNSLRAQALLTPRFNSSERTGLDYWLEMNLDNLMGFVYDNVGGGGGGAVNSVTGTLPVVATGTTNVVISMAAAGAGTDGYLTSANWNTFNNKQELLVNQVNIKSVNGQSLLGSGDLVVSGGTSTEEVQDIVGTMIVAGTNMLVDYDDLNNIVTLSSTATGGGGGTVTEVTATAPVTSSGGTAPVIGMPKATASVDGYLDNADWTLFNGKQAPATTLAGYGITDAYTKTETDSALATKQPIDADLTSIAGLAGTSGLLRKTAANTWSLDTSSYSLVGHSHAISDVTGLQTALDSKLALAGGTMVGPINWADGDQTATLDLVPDPLSSTGDVFNVESDAGVQVKGPYVVLDTTNLQMTMPGAQLNAAITVAAIDAYGVVSLGYTALPPPSYSVLDTTNTPVLIKAAGVAPPTAWVSLGLSVTLAQDIAAGTGNVGFEGIFVNNTARLGTVEFGLRVNGAAVSARDIVTQISPNFNQTIGMSLPLINAYTNGDLLELMARVTTNDNNAFQLTMANSDTDLGAMRIYTTPSSGGGGTGSVDSVGGVAPIVSSGGSSPQISMPAATTTVDGYLSAANFNTFNGKANAATTLAGYGITDAYTKTQTDAAYPTKAGAGATGTWGINISGVAASASAVAWGNVTGKPTTIAGYGITDCYTKVEVDSFLSGKADDATTLAGYGITDAYTKVQADAQFQEPATTLAGYGITDAYTKTQSDAAYPTKAGSGATGTWGINISGSAATAASATAALGVDDLNSTATIKQWVGLQAEYDVLGSWDSATFYNITDAETPSIPGGGTTVAWDDVTGKPSTFPPSAHGHAISEVTNLQTTLDGKAATIHAHAIADVTGLQTALDGKAPTTHNHTTAQVTGLDTALAAKAPIADPLFTGNARAPTQAVNTNNTQIATTAFVQAEIAADAPTKAGGGATGTWPIGISGTAALATAVNDNGTNPSMKFWYGTEAEYIAIGTKDPSTIYFRSA